MIPSTLVSNDKNNIGTLIAEGPDIIYIDINEKVGFRINFNQLLLGCKNTANKGLRQILSTKNNTLTIVDKTIIKKSVLSFVKC